MNVKNPCLYTKARLDKKSKVHSLVASAQRPSRIHTTHGHKVHFQFARVCVTGRSTSLAGVDQISEDKIIRAGAAARALRNKAVLLASFPLQIFSLLYIFLSRARLLASSSLRQHRLLFSRLTQTCLTAAAPMIYCERPISKRKNDAPEPPLPFARR